MADPVRNIRALAGYLTYNPGPGIYSRLERAVEAMPEMVRADELPGLLKRHKEGVPGWEMRAADLDSVIAGRDVVPREELLARVRANSPVYTHREVVLGGNQPGQVISRDTGAVLPEYQSEPSQLGRGVSHWEPKYERYGQGGRDYAEILLGQPDVPGEYGSHWGGGLTRSTPDVRNYARNNIVAHARYDTHGDALRINELQSDLGIHNRKMRERAGEEPGPLGWDNTATPTGTQELPFPMEDNWSDLLIKRLALEAARQGHRAIEIASPRAIADKVGGNIDNYEHFYGKVVPGALERLGRKMGGLTPDSTGAAPELVRRPPWTTAKLQEQATDAMHDAVAMADGLVGRLPGQRSAGGSFEEMVDALALGSDPREQAAVLQHAKEMHSQMVITAVRNGWPAEAAQTLVGQAMPRIMREAENIAALNQARVRVAALASKYAPPPPAPQPPGWRYLMSDEMRRRLIEQGVGASVLAPLLTAGQSEE